MQACLIMDILSGGVLVEALNPFSLIRENISASSSIDSSKIRELSFFVFFNGALGKDPLTVFLEIGGIFTLSLKINGICIFLVDGFFTG